MNFVDQGLLAAATPQAQAHYRFPRSDDLLVAWKSCVTDYAIGRQTGKEFEARGLLVTGESGVGKTHETRELKSKFDGSTDLFGPDKKARIVTCELSRRQTWKDLGSKVLHTLGYPIVGNRNQSYIWERVTYQAREQGVVAIHFDECQHVFSPKAKSNRVFLDSFKSLLKNKNWPMMLILSGVPVLGDFVEEEPQLRRLLRPIHFPLLNTSSDIEEINRVTFAYSDLAGVSCEDLATQDFYERLGFTCSHRWGLVIKLLVNALAVAKSENAASCTKGHFAKALEQLFGVPEAYSPFTVDEYRSAFDPATILQSVRRAE